MIQEDYVSFETAKLLADKGFNEKCRAFYVNAEEWGIYLYPTEGSHNFNDVYPPRTSAPTVQMAMKWLRESYNNIVYVKPLEDGNCYVSHILYNGIDHLVEGGAFGTYEEACEAAIKYCLEKLNNKKS